MTDEELLRSMVKWLIEEDLPRHLKTIDELWESGIKKYQVMAVREEALMVKSFIKYPNALINTKLVTESKTFKEINPELQTKFKKAFKLE